jgi:hypothetical protein
MTTLPTDNATRLAVLVEGALAAGTCEARPIVDADGKPATLTDCGKVTLLRVINETRKGTDRIDCFLVDDDDDDEIRLASDRLFSLQERGPEPPELVVHNRDVKTWLAPVLLALATKVAPDGDDSGQA